MSSTHDIETALLGAVIVDPAALDRIAYSVDGSDFVDRDLGRVLSHLLDLHACGEPLGDVVMLRHRLATAGLLDAIGGSAGIARLAGSGIPSSAERYATEIRQAAHRRKLSAIAAELTSRSADVTTDPTEIADWVEGQLSAVRSGVLCDSRTLAETAREAISEIREAKAAGVKRGLPTGFGEVDQLIGGMHAGEMFILAARPSIGKSALAAQIASNVAMAGEPVLFVSLEMTGADMAYRTLAGMTGIEIRELRAANVTNAELNRCDDAVREIADVPWFLWSSRSATVGRIRAAAKVQRSRTGLSMLVVDYLGLVRPDDPRKPRWEQITESSNAFKRLAEELGVPALILCQLNRDADKDKGGPRLDHLRESGAIEQDADIVGLLHRESRSSRMATLNIAKNRNGPIDEVDLSFDPSSCRFTDPRSKDHPNYNGELAEFG